jgi:hypothetical protein
MIFFTIFAAGFFILSLLLIGKANSFFASRSKLPTLTIIQAIFFQSLEISKENNKTCLSSKYTNKKKPENKVFGL